MDDHDIDFTERKIDEIRDDIKNIILTLTANTNPYILIGGASLIIHGSTTRITKDVDLLVQKTSVDGLSTRKASALEAYTFIKDIDLLTEIVEPIDFDSLVSLAIEINGITVAPLDVLLGTKILSHYRRPDGVEGDNKRRRDLLDIDWICRELKKSGKKARKKVTDKLVCGPYNMLLVVDNLYRGFGKDNLEIFDEVGGREFEGPSWGSTKFKQQSELYEMEIEFYPTSEELILLGSRRKPEASASSGLTQDHYSSTP